MDGSFPIRISNQENDDPRIAMLNGLSALNILNEHDVRHVQPILEKNHDALDQIICKLGLVTEEKIAAAYARIFSRPLLEIKDGTQPPPLTKDIAAALNRNYLFSNRLTPIARAEEKMIVALVDPSNERAIAGVAFALQSDIDLRIVTASQFDRIFTSLFPEEDATIHDDNADPSGDIDHLKDMASAEPVIRYVNRLISEASRRRASDIHIEPASRNAIVRLRIDGALVEFETLGRAQALSVISRFKILADLDIAEQRRPQDGRMSFAVAGRAIDLRLSTSPTIKGESLVIRLLDQSLAPLSLDGLGFDADARACLQKWIEAPNGLILLTGPTGSGKTTTLYSLLRLLATGERKILTIEDPVEYNLPGVNQSQVNSPIGVTFAHALRSFLRHDPDVIMVGEMRDAETARIAMRAAMTGHLVLSTLHTNDAPSAIARLLDMDVEDYLVASALLGVVGQRLVRRVCSNCAGASETKDCAQCDGGGFAGRIVVSEILDVDENVRSCIKKGVTATEIMRAAKERGFTSMSEDGGAKAAKGLTTMKEVKRAVGSHGF